MRLASFGPKPEISVVVPCFNEDVVLPETTRRLTASLERIGRSLFLCMGEIGTRATKTCVSAGRMFMATSDASTLREALAWP